MSTTTVSSEIELPSFAPPSHATGSTTDEFSEGSNVQLLPRADGGFLAWRVLVTAYIFEALLWGFPLSFGVFQDYYSQLPEFQDSPFISVIGTVASGLSYLAAPMMISMCRRYAKYRKVMIWIGCLPP